MKFIPHVILFLCNSFSLLFLDIFIPQPRLDFYACVQAKKRKDSPHGKNTVRTAEGSVSEIEGLEFKNKLAVNPGSKKVSLGPYY